MRCSNSIFSILFLSFLGASGGAFAYLPLPPRFSGNVTASNYTVGQLDLMLPMAGDVGHNLYLDPILAYGSDNQGYGDLGLGYRLVKNDAAILGGYLFGGYSRINNNARLWVVNPGIEALGSRWDAHLNGYWVMGERNNVISALTTTGKPFFTGHSEVINRFQTQTDQHAGSGANVQFAYQVFPQSSLKIYVGSYFFSPPQTNNIWGGALGVEYWLDSHVKLMASYSYDNYRHSTVALGLGIELGGTHVCRVNPDLEERMTDPVARYLSELGSGSAIPSRTTTIISQGGQEVLSNNIAFFSQTGSPNHGGDGLTITNCTFENPCGPEDFSSAGTATLASLLPNTQMYFNGGSYGGTADIPVNDGQSVHGRTADYSSPATGDARSTLTGSILLNSNTVYEDVKILSTNATQAGSGISGTDVSGVSINDTEIGSMVNPFATGINLAGSSDLSLTNSSIYAAASPGAQSIGISANNGTLAVSNSNIISTGRDVAGWIAQSSSGTLIVQGSNITSTGNVISIGIVQQGSLILQDSLVTASEATGLNGGILIAGNNPAQTTQIENSTITSTSASRGSSVVYGIASQSSNVGLTITDSQITASGITLAGDPMAAIFVNADGNVINANNVTLTARNSHTACAQAFILALEGSNNSVNVNNGILVATGSAGTAIVSNPDRAPVIMIQSTCIVNEGTMACS